jgi:hypothetical protein
MADLHRFGLVARMELSVIRGQPIRIALRPHPGYGLGIAATTFGPLQRTFEFLQIIDICLTLSVPRYADKLASKHKLASKRSGWNAQGLR